MSRGSYFELLKETRHKDAIPVHAEGNGIEKPDEFGPKPKSRFSRKGEDPWGDLLDTKTGTLFSSVLHLEFNSTFSSLREHYEEIECLTPYNGENVHIISRKEAKEMIRAIDYILLGKYDMVFERILGKTYVEIFGDYDKDYSLWKYRRMFPEDKEYAGNDLEDTKNSMMDIRTILNAYLIATSDPFGENKSEYLLTYTIWG